LLFLASLKASENQRTALLGGAAAHLVLGGMLFRMAPNRPLLQPITVLPCLTGFVWLWLAKLGAQDAFTCMAQGLLLLVPAGLLAAQTVASSGAAALRHAKALAQQLTRRTEWPADMNACRQLPETRALREAIFREAGPVLPYLQHPCTQVRLVVLAALEFRKTWRQGQPELVLAVAQSDPVPAVRAAALLALGSVPQRLFVEPMAEALRDPASEVRRAAAEALLWDIEHRWIWIRTAIHQALADPRFLKDGALTVTTGSFTPQAIADICAWATENGPLGVRSTQTLLDHYRRLLAEQPDPLEIAQLRDQVASVRTSAVLRVELAQLLHLHGLLTDALLEQMLHPNNPSSLRLLAVESLLQNQQNERAVEVLRDVARQPNRELALTAAILVQKYLHVDMGLQLGAPPPALHTRQAAEVTHRVIQWAQNAAVEDAASTAGTKAVIEW
ncbi:MAG TPA: HEAT repeat domain-containing protein, partial [Gemmataceae bacterium]|nr:HEAT repeat domain-containing protein [Gemmataceae bacterium]